MVIRTASMILLLLVGAGSVGCLIVPIPRSTEEEGIRATLRREQAAFIHAGETRRRDVLLSLGEPDETHVRGHYYSCYVSNASRTDLHWSVFIPIPPRGAAVSGVSRQGSREFLLIQFDPSGLVQKYKFEKVAYTLIGNNEGLHKSIGDLVREWEEKESE